MYKNPLLFLSFFYLIYATSAHAFVGTISIGVGRMTEEVGEVTTSFTADATLETEEMTTQAKIYYQPGMVRDELNMKGQQVVTISRFDLNKVWMLLGHGMYIETDTGQNSDKVPQFELVSREVVGREEVNGMDTTKYKSIYKSKDGKFGGFTWYTDDNIAVKAFMISETKGEKQRVKYEFTNLERGPQDAALFELPDNVRKMNMDGMSGMFGSAKAPSVDEASTGTSSQPGQGEDAQEEPGFVEGVAEDSVEEAKDSAAEEIVKEVGNSVREGFGKLFGR